MRLLLAEDEKSLSRALKAILEKNHYEVDAVYNGADALDYALLGEYDGMILDWMMPQKDGLSVLKSLRKAGKTLPVLMLTAKAEIDNKVEGLDGGANDYLTKPFDSRELLARLRVMLRSGQPAADTKLRFGTVSLDSASFELEGPKGKMVLPGKEYQMLEMLMRHPGQVISADTFMDHIWGLETDTDPAVVWVNLSYLRRKLESVGADIEIKARRGMGYCLKEMT